MNANLSNLKNELSDNKFIIFEMQKLIEADHIDFDISKLLNDYEANSFMLIISLNNQILHKALQILISHSSFEILDIINADNIFEADNIYFDIDMRIFILKDRNEFKLSAHSVLIDLKRDEQINSDLIDEEEDHIQESNIKDKNLENSSLYLFIYAAMRDLFSNTKYAAYYIIEEDLKNESVRILYNRAIFKKEQLELISALLCKNANIRFAQHVQNEASFIVEYFQD